MGPGSIHARVGPLSCCIALSISISLCTCLYSEPRRLLGEEPIADRRSPIAISSFSSFMKISFSIPSKSGSSKPNLIGASENCEASKDYIREFDGSKSPAGKPDVLIIPPKQNEWMPSMNMRKIHLPFSDSVSSDILFEQESSHVPDSGHGSKISYGVNLRKSNDSAASDSTAICGEDEFESAIGQPRVASAEVVRLQKLKDDLKRLPEDRGFEEFKKISVEAFGTALLAGYGWHEGRGIGKNAKEDTKVVQFMNRTDKHGLGFRR